MMTKRPTGVKKKININISNTIEFGYKVEISFPPLWYNRWWIT